MMGINLIWYLRKEIPQAKFYVECDDYNLQRLKEATSIEELENVKMPKNKSNSFTIGIYKYLTKTHPRIKYIGKNFDVQINLGGDDFSGKEKAMVSMALQYRQIQSMGVTVILAGQTMGDFRKKWVKFLTSKFLKNIYITTRDNISYRQLSALGLKRIYDYRDLALLPLPRQEFFNNTSLVSQLKPDGKYITLVPTGHFMHYGMNKAQAIDAWIKIVVYIRKKYPQYDIVLLPHVISHNNGSDDRNVIRPLWEYFKSDNRMTTYLDEMQPQQARAIIAGSHMIVTGRMHAAVSSFATRRPSISLAYSIKYWGVISKGFDTPQLVLDCREGIMKEGCFIEQFVQRFDEVYNDTTEMEVKIKTGIEVNEQIAFEHIIKLKEIITGK